MSPTAIPFFFFTVKKKKAEGLHCMDQNVFDLFTVTS